MNPFEGRLVDVIPTKASVWGKGMRTPRKRDSFTVGHHRDNRVACLIGSYFNSSLVGLRFVQNVYVG